MYDFGRPHVYYELLIKKLFNILNYCVRKFEARNYKEQENATLKHIFIYGGMVVRSCKSICITSNQSRGN